MHRVPSYFFLQGTACPRKYRITITVVHGNHKHWGTLMKSAIVKRSILIAGHKTSVSLEDAFWRALKEIARAQNASLSHTVAEIDKARKQGNNLSSAIRLFVLDRALTPATREPAMLSSLEIEAASPNGALHSQ